MGIPRYWNDNIREFYRFHSHIITFIEGIADWWVCIICCKMTESELPNNNEGERSEQTERIVERLVRKGNLVMTVSCDGSNRKLHSITQTPKAVFDDCVHMETSVFFMWWDDIKLDFFPPLFFSLTPVIIVKTLFRRRKESYHWNVESISPKNILGMEKTKDRGEIQETKLPRFLVMSSTLRNIRG